MKPKLILPLVVFAAVAALIFAYTEGVKEREADAEEDQSISAKSTVAQTNGVTVIHLDLKAQQLAGLKTITVSAAALPPEIKVYGRVLDSAALISRQSDLVTARAALQASRAEYDRLKKLSVQDNVSAHTLDLAEAQLARDQGALVTAGAQLAAASSKTVADQPADFFQSLAKQKSVLVLLDLPAGEISAEMPIGAGIISQQSEANGRNQFVTGKFLGHATTVDPRTQGEGFIFSVTNAPVSLMPGLDVTGFLSMPGEPSHGVIVPDDAVVRSDGRAWIYAQTGGKDFERREIILNHPIEGGWFVTNGVVAGEKIVVAGAQVLLSEERKSQIKLED
ncbi:MAG: hypothetical protein ACREDS_02865 [Limisphaerales bacterium]